MAADGDEGDTRPAGTEDGAASDADGARAWSFFQCDPDYRAEWRDAAAAPAWEDAPFVG